MNALFIGRFQPFHLGHLQVIKEHIHGYDHLYIGIGSSQYEYTNENPFSYEERETMIDLSLKDEHIQDYSIVPIPDIHDPPRWVDHVCTLIHDFTDVFTNNANTAQLFKQKGFTVHQPGFYEKNQYSGEEIRKRMKQHRTWGELVPKKVYTYLCSIQAEQRLQNLG